MRGGVEMLGLYLGLTVGGLTVGEQSVPADTTPGGEVDVLTDDDATTGLLDDDGATFLTDDH